MLSQAGLGEVGLDPASRQRWRSMRAPSRARGCVTTNASSKRNRSFGASDIGPDPWKEEERRQALLKYVREVQPTSVVQFAEQTHPTVVQAMRQTVLNVVGSLPPQYFSVRIQTVAESLSHLFLSILTTGYMLRAAQFRLELQNSLKALPAHASAAPAAAAATAPAADAAAAVAGPPTTVAAFANADYLDSADTATVGGAQAQAGPGAAFLYDGDGSPYAPGVQKKNVEGEVLRWHLARGEVERLPAGDYIELLERELAALRAQVGQAAAPVPPAAFPAGPPLPGANTPLATAGGVEVLGPEAPTGSPLGPSSPSPDSLTYVSPLPGFGERSGVVLAAAGAAGGAAGALAAAGASAAAPATMGSGGIPLVVGSPLGLPRNELLDYLHALQASGSGGFKELACSPSTASGQAVKEAMELFVTRLMGLGDLTAQDAEFSSVELSKVLFWLMAVGYNLKSIESRMELEDGMGGAGPSSAGGSGGRGGGSGSGGKGSGGGNDKGSGNGNGGKKGGFGGLRGLLPGW